MREFTPPHVSIGEVVLFRKDNAIAEWCPAVITKTADRTVNLSVINDGWPKLACYTAWFYADPEITEERPMILGEEETGVYKLTEIRERLDAAYAAVEPTPVEPKRGPGRPPRLKAVVENA